MSSSEHMSNLFMESSDDVFLTRCTDKDIPNPVELKEHFSIRVLNREGLFEFFWVLSGSKVFFYKPESKMPAGCMNLINSYMEIAEPFFENNKLYFGLRFSKKTAYEELFSNDEGTVLYWFDKLKRYCIRQDFDQNYRLTEMIGQGSFAKVYKAERNSDKRLFAAKVFDKKSSTFEKTSKIIRNELNTLRNINHERCIKFLELYESKNYVYCITELYFGPSLHKCFESKLPLSETIALVLVKQILEGVSYLHSKRIIHRDLKLENILFKESKELINLVIIDFGFATNEDAEPLLQRCGSLGFVAPEILRDEEFSCKADIFSIGGILHKLFAN